MYSKTLKISLFKINQAKLIFVQLEKLVKFKLLLFHAATYLWHLWLNFHTFIAVRALFINRWDIVERTCGMGSQYITVWNQVILQVYFNACFALDVLDIAFPDRYDRLRSAMRKIVPFCFTSLVFPISFVVAINFWTYYPIKHEIIDEENVMEMYIPHWINHGLHTTIVFFVLMEKILVKHSYERRFWSYLGISSLIVAYALTCTILFMWGGVWPYPLIRLMTDRGKIVFVLANCLLGILFVALGEAINNRVWGTPKSCDAAAQARKTEKVS